MKTLLCAVFLTICCSTASAGVPTADLDSIWAKQRLHEEDPGNTKIISYVFPCQIVYENEAKKIIVLTPSETIPLCEKMHDLAVNEYAKINETK